MRAKTVNEEVNFKRGQDPKRAMDIGHTPDKWEVFDSMIDTPEGEERYNRMRPIVNEYIDDAKKAFPKAGWDHIESALEAVIASLVEQYAEEYES